MKIIDTKAQEMKTKLTEIDELFDGERRGIKLRIKVQHFADIFEHQSRQPHLGADFQN